MGKLLLKIIYVLLILAQHHKVYGKKDRMLKDVGKAIFKSIRQLSAYFAFGSEAFLVYELFQTFYDSMNPAKSNTNSIALSDVSSQIDELSQNMLRFETEILKKLDTLKDDLEMTNKLRDIHVHKDRINFLYRHGYLNFINASKIYFNDTKVNFAKKILSFDSDGVNYPLEKIHKLILERDTAGKNIPMYYSGNDDISQSFMCEKKQSAQRLIFATFGLISVTELKGLILMTYAFKILRNRSNSKNRTSELDDAKIFQRERMAKTFRAIKMVAESASREIWPCDPEYHKLGITHEKFGPLFQKYVMDEGDAYPENPFDSSNTQIGYISNMYSSNFARLMETSRLCQKNCPYNEYVEQPYCHSRFCKSKPPKLVCHGHVHDCEYLDGNLYICLGTQTDDRRYLSIRTGDGRVFGDDGTCPTKELTATLGYAFGTWYSCDFCLCTCEDNLKRDLNKFINLIPVTSDIEDNKIVTGVQIVNVKNIFHIKIQQGTLLSKGRVDPQSISWKDVLGYSVNDMTFKSGVDYHEITWKQRTFHLDDLEGYEGHVLIGLKFMLDKDKNIKLAIQTVPFDFNTGQLVTDDSLWIDSSINNEALIRDALELPKPGDPTYYNKHVPDSQTNQYIKLTTSDMEQDAGQTVVPFFDIQQVISSYPMPLSGAGLIHKGFRNSAGFITLKIFTFNINKLLQSEVEK